MSQSESLPQAEIIHEVQSVMISSDESQVDIYHGNKYIKITPIVVHSKLGCKPCLEIERGGVLAPKERAKNSNIR